MKVTGLPMLLAAALLVIGAAATLLVREDFASEELAAAMLMMGAGLVAFGAWLAMEIAAFKQRNVDGIEIGQGGPRGIADRDA